MAHVADVVSAEFFRVAAPGEDDDWLLVQASGEVPSSGWAGARLVPRFYAEAPPDGLWEFDFLAWPPGGRVVDTRLAVHAHALHGLPQWFRGVKVYAAEGSLVSAEGRQVPWVGAAGARPRGHGTPGVSLTQTLAAYESGFAGPPATRCWRHRLAVTVEGPDEQPIRQGLADLMASDQATVLAQAYARGGGQLAAQVGLLLRQLRGRLGPRFDVHVDDDVQWMEHRG